MYKTYLYIFTIAVCTPSKGLVPDPGCMSYIWNVIMSGTVSNVSKAEKGWCGGGSVACLLIGVSPS